MAIAFFTIFRFNLVPLALVTAGIFLLLVVRLRSLWELRAEGFAAATIGLEKYCTLDRAKKLSGLRWLGVYIFEPYRLLKKVEKVAREKKF
jgi:hypothetical protein